LPVCADAGVSVSRHFPSSFERALCIVIHYSNQCQTNHTEIRNCEYRCKEKCRNPKICFRFFSFSENGSGADPQGAAANGGWVESESHRGFNGTRFQGMGPTN